MSIKIYTNNEKQEEEFPKLSDYGNLVYTPEQLADINSTEGNKLNTAINDDGQVITDLINSKLNTQTKEILDTFTFGSSGAIKIATDSNNGIWISPTGILGKHSGSTTFALDTSGNATFSGNITAATITGGTITGSTIQTSTSGQRVVIDSSNDYIKFYDSNGNLSGTISGAPTYGIYSDGDFYITGNLNGVQNLHAYYLDISKGSGAGIEPTWNDSITLGSSSYRWNNVYATHGNFSNQIIADSISTNDVYGGYIYSNSIYPNSADSYYCGTSSAYWLAVYSYYYYAKDTTIHSFEAHDDISLIKNIKPRKINVIKPMEKALATKGKGKTIPPVLEEKEVWDASTFPKEVRKGDFVQVGALHGLTIGALKQLIDRVEKLEQKVNNNIR